MAWFETARLKGIRLERRPDPSAPGGFDRVVVEDPTAGPIWARFYEIGTNRPIYSDRDGVIKYRLADIGYERRNGYAWLGDWPADLLARDYPAWKAFSPASPCSRPDPLTRPRSARGRRRVARRRRSPRARRR
jgi:hypothetical protein